MKITGAAGWERITPLDEYPELSCEIKRFSLVERMEFSDQFTDDDGMIRLKFGDAEGREVFNKYTRKIVGLEFNGKEINQPDQLLGPDMPFDEGVQNFIIMTVSKIWDMNFANEEEIKNSETPSSLTGNEAASQPEAN